jgi:hypothetical protein
LVQQSFYFPQNEKEKILEGIGRCEDYSVDAAILAQIIHEYTTRRSETLLPKRVV